MFCLVQSSTQFVLPILARPERVRSILDPWNRHDDSDRFRPSLVLVSGESSIRCNDRRGSSGGCDRNVFLREEEEKKFCSELMHERCRMLWLCSYMCIYILWSSNPASPFFFGLFSLMTVLFPVT